MCSENNRARGIVRAEVQKTAERDLVCLGASPGMGVKKRRSAGDLWEWLGIRWNASSKESQEKGKTIAGKVENQGKGRSMSSLIGVRVQVELRKRS